MSSAHANQTSVKTTITSWLSILSHLPAAMFAALPPHINDHNIIHCPVISNPNSHHILLDSLRYLAAPSLSISNCHTINHNEKTQSELVPSAGKLCWLIFPGGEHKHVQQFLGPVQKVAQYQATRVVVLIEHIHSPAILSLAIPYGYFKDIQTLQRQLSAQHLGAKLVGQQPDSGSYLPGKPKHLQFKCHITCSHLRWQVSLWILWPTCVKLTIDHSHSMTLCRSSTYNSSQWNTFTWWHHLILSKEPSSIPPEIKMFPATTRTGQNILESTRSIREYPGTTSKSQHFLWKQETPLEHTRTF